ncbi:enoyl-CoA hydratase [Steroidobacter agaridevorans]|uniref:Enoyl-CoA hydratase n=1 Tax=Steroidobacter agaridevorans TaxID=2695856 RepID=A0A829YF59_9GAMM|nr:enoyl-CoA hydratase-related protein [Steroidobacter agaridevorans]GFE82065.1 enoyl-CoA hydratase [Steroidobacter agaridevorans]GFE85547.1 enoyl-CoA hydratase [Steroidobacter agaridevorans]
MKQENLSDTVRLHSPAPHVAVITIDRPEARNAVSASVAEGIDRALTLTEADTDTWVVVLTGAGGKAFCAGADLKEVAAGRAATLGTSRGGFAGFVNYSREKPWIAAVEGFALGGGFEIVLTCDMVVAAETATFGLPETSRGLMAAAGGVYRLPRLLPRNIAIELIATGKVLSATQAHAHGLVNRVASAGSALDVAVELAQAVAKCAPVAVRESLKVARVAADMSDAELRVVMRQAFERNASAEDYREGPRAFLEKRAPQWLGR